MSRPPGPETGHHLRRGTEAPAADQGAVADVVEEGRALLDPLGDPELEALKLAILLEDALDVPLTDAEIELATLTDPTAVGDILARRGRRR
jgi:hypothetical protein